MFEGRPVGVAWSVVGFMGQELQPGLGTIPESMGMHYDEPSLLRRQAPATLNFRVEYRHSLDWLAANPRPPSATASVKPSLFSFGSRSSADPTLTAVLEKTLVVPPEPIRVSLELSALSSSHTVTKVKLTARQTITYRLPTGNLHFRGTIGRIEETPAPRYDTKNTPFSGTFELRVAEGLGGKGKGPFRKKDVKIPAQAMPLDFRTGDADGMIEFVPSTPMIKQVEGTWGVDVKYTLQVSVGINDAQGGFLNKGNKELEVELPFVLTNATDGESVVAGVFFK